MAKRAPLGAGSLRHLILIEEQAATATGRANEQLTEWVPYRRAYAAIRNAPGREYMQQGSGGSSSPGQVRSEQVFRFTCRYTEVLGVTHGMRIKFQGAAYDITDIRPDLESLIETVLEARLVK